MINSLKNILIFLIFLILCLVALIYFYLGKDISTDLRKKRGSLEFIKMQFIWVIRVL
jgi:hypothetical protein